MDPKCIEFGLSEGACSAISPGLYAGYIFFGVAVVALVVLNLLNLLKNPSVLIKTGISVGALAILFGISYGLADGTPNAISNAFNLSEGSIRLISAGLIMFYIAILLAIVGVIYSEINKALK